MEQLINADRILFLNAANIVKKANTTMSAGISWSIIFIEFILKCTFLLDSLKKDKKQLVKKKDLSRREKIQAQLWIKKDMLEKPV